MPRRIGWLTLSVLLSLVSLAPAVITADFPLKAVLKSEQHIVVARVEKLDANLDLPRMVLKVDENLKGKAPFEKLAINLTAASAEGKKLKHTEELLKRLEPGLPIVVFASKRGSQHIAFAYTNGTWFQMHGRETTPGAFVWSFMNCEPYLRRTFKGPTGELRQVIIDALAGKKEPPPTNPKEEPGLGPVIGTKGPRGSRIEDRGSRISDAATWRHGDTATKDNNAELRSELEYQRVAASPRRRVAASIPLAMIMPPVFGVIPTVAVGGPLAILAMLFPALFGKPQDVLRRWLALLTVVSIASILYLAWQFWPGSEWLLWQIITGLTVLGAIWGLARYWWAVGTGYGEMLRPSDGEGVVFRILSVVAFGLIAYGLGAGALLIPPFKEFVLMAAVVWAGTLGILLLAWQSKRDPEAPPRVPLESMMLTALARVSVGMAWSVKTPAACPAVEASELLAGNWTFQPEADGRIDSTPLVTEDRVFIAAAHAAGFSQFGTLYCLDRGSGKKLWEFSDDGAMKQVFSSPFLVGDRLFIGEGYHQHADCKLYCLEAKTGQKFWEFATMSHTESSPCVADGKVYFGAGDDGVYCVDAASGKEVWHYQGLHVDTSPTVADGRVFCGSAYGSRYYIFCLDARTGSQVWREEWKHPVFGSPAVIGSQVYFGAGNGNMLQSDARPAGALLCVHAETGKLVWPAFEVPDSVLMRPAVDGKHVYFGSRDGQVYCLKRKDGSLAWKKAIGSPVVTAPALAGCSACGSTSTVYAASSDGQVFCLDPDSGETYWSYAMPRQFKPQLLSSPRLFAGAGNRRLYFGAVLDHEGILSGALYCLEDRYPWPVIHGHSAGTAVAMGSKRAD